MGALLNLVGLSAGIVLYAMLLLMVLRARRILRVATDVDPLLLATAVLGLAWNVCALLAYALPVDALASLGLFHWLPLFTFIGASALGFLPAVVVHSVLRGDQGHSRPWPSRILLGTAYSASIVAVLMHATALLAGTALPSPLAMRLLTVVFIVLLVPLAWVTRGQPGSRRALWVAALSAFAVSALHLSQVDPVNPSWSIELVGHHASLPLAVAILYQDFPFAFADLFLKRAITLLVLVATPFVAVSLLGGRAAAAALSLGDPRVVGSLVVLWAATLLSYSRLRQASAWFVDTVVLHRPDYASLRARLGRVVQRGEEIGPMLDEACRELAPALSARLVRWHERDDAGAPLDERRGAASIVIDVPVAEAPHYALEVAGLTGGRRLLSDDHHFLDDVAALLGRRIDALRITRERFAREIREQEMAKLTTEAELRALRAQLNPHFLFNALTTIGHLIQTSPSRALSTLMRMTTLLRAVLRSDGELTTLERELNLIESYLDIERARFEHRLRVEIDVPVNVRRVQIPSLLLQPLVENAVKHGIARRCQGGAVVITGRLTHGAQGECSELIVTVRDTGAGATESELQHGRRSGVGLNNIERRLVCHYGAAAALTLTSEPGAGTTVEVRVPAGYRASTDVPAERSA